MIVSIIIVMWLLVFVAMFLSHASKSALGIVAVIGSFITLMVIQWTH